MTKWDPKSKGNDINVRDNLVRVANTRGVESTVTLDHVIRDGEKFSFSVRIETLTDDERRGPEGFFTIGFVPSDCKSWEHPVGHPETGGFGVTISGDLRGGGRTGRALIWASAEGDTLTATADLTKGEILFANGGRDMCVAYTGVRGPLRPAVSLGTQYIPTAEVALRLISTQ